MKGARPLVALGATASVVLGAAEAVGCPSCPPNRAARDLVFGPDFWPQLLLVALPLVVVGVVSAFLYRIGMEARPWRRDRTGEP